MKGLLFSEMNLYDAKIFTEDYKLLIAVDLQGFLKGIQPFFNTA